MKLSKLFFGVAAAAMFAACSSDDVVADLTPEWNAEGNGYVAFSISTAEEVANRAPNDNFGDGEATEYAVNDVTLVTCAADGTVFEAFTMAPGFGDPKNPDSNVSVDKLYVQKISKTDSTPYAFVIINKNNVFSVDGGKLYYGSTQITNINNLATTVKDDLNLTADAFTNNGILMMNAPLSTKAGTTADPNGATLKTLVNELKVYPTEEAANIHAEGIGEVFVERAVAKVELTGEDKNTGGLTWEIKGWTLDNTNKSSYLLHNVRNMTNDVNRYNADSKGYRMIGSLDVQHNLPASLGTGTAEHLFRTYFGQDPNMGLAPADQAAAFNRVADYKALTFGNPKYQYCAENLFDVGHQDYGNTTRALIKVKLDAPAGTTYFSKPGDDKFYTLEAVENAAKTVAATKIASSKLWPYIVLDAGKTEVELTPSVNTTTGAITVTAKNAHLEITDAEAYTAGYADAAEAQTAFVALFAQSLVAKDLGYNFYKEGIAYYDVRIKHFGNTYCPWDKKDENINTTVKSYDWSATDPAAQATASNLYLGRWGVLRNNWYAINITDIKKLGYADPYDLDLKPRTPGDPNNPDGPDPETPDDNTPDSEKWIAVDVNVLSWAKRLNDETL